MFHNAGAYCFSMASNYNSRYRPAEVLVWKGQSHLIRKREVLADLLKNQTLDLSIRDHKCLSFHGHKVVILVTMGDLLNDIIRLYDMKKFFWLFVFVVLAMQFVAFTTYGSFYWYLGDYLWYLFVFFGLVNVLIITRRRAKQKLQESFERKMKQYKENFIGNLKLDSRIFDVDPSEVAVINDQPIVVEGRQEHLEKMREFLNTIKNINEKIEDHWPDEEGGEWWSDRVDAEVFQALKIREDDIEPVKQSKEALKFWLGNYNTDLKKLKEVKKKGADAIYEKGILAMTPLILMFVIALQLANVTNKLLYHVFGG